MSNLLTDTERVMRKLFLILALVVAGTAPLAAQSRARPRAVATHQFVRGRAFAHRAMVRRAAVRRAERLRARRMLARQRARRPMPWMRG